MDDSDVSVVQGKDKAVELHYKLYKNGNPLTMTKEELLTYYDVVVTNSKGEISIVSKSKMKNKTNNWKEYIHLAIEVRVPANTLSVIESIDGDIALQGLQGKQYCKTQDGDIAVSNITGTIDVYTGDGDIAVADSRGNAQVKTNDGDVAINKLIGNVEVVSGDGDIAINNLIGMLNAKAVDGDIKVSIVKGGIIAHSGDGDIVCRVEELKGELTVSNGDGDISVTLPKGIGMNLEMRGEDLKIGFADFDGELDDDYIIGKVNGGGIPVSIKTNDGDIRFNFN